LVKSEHAAQRVFESLCCFVEKRLGLEVNREKSAVRSAKELSYLGFSFRRKKIVVSEDSLSDFKYRLKELSNRNWSVSMDYRISKIHQYIRGWMGYFGLSAIYSIWLPIDRWLRRRIRMCYPSSLSELRRGMLAHVVPRSADKTGQLAEPEQCAKRRYLNMRKLGAKHKEAGGFARTSKGYWRVAKHLGYKAGMTNEWLAN
jgi:RNA-directed DNA polymerase